MLLDSTSHIVWKFQKDWMKNETKTKKIGDGPLKLDESSAPGSDGVNHKLLKLCAVTLSYPLLIIYVKSLREGNFH